ncbi:MAG: polysaccharide deacetylase family protein [Planctomycetes bacterium]|nr:polysaccharide deacetylase family protein [Planctomycetota bacterium]
MGHFKWPEGKTAALSLTFDDARASQLDVGLPILDRHAVPATFYVSPAAVEPRLGDWREVVGKGHEIGNHTMTHPCSETFSWSRENALENYTLEGIMRDIEEASDYIRSKLGVEPVTCAYPCGQKFVGRGAERKSYMPLVSERFVAARSAFEMTANDPFGVDLADVAAVSVDSAPVEDMLRHAEKAAAEGRWLVFLCHEVGKEPGPQTLTASEFDAFCTEIRAPGSPFWIDTFEGIARHILRQRKGE